MTAEGSPNIFSLSEIHPKLSGQRFVELRSRLERGIASLNSLLSGCSLAVFDHVSEFDYDGLTTSIGAISGFQSERDTAVFAYQRLKDQFLARLEQPKWHLQSEPVKPANVLPATGNRMPGRLPTQIASAGLRASGYESCYIRVYLVQSEPASLVDNLMANNFFVDGLVWYLDKSLGSET